MHGLDVEADPNDAEARRVTVDVCERCEGVLLDFFDGEPSDLSRRLVGPQPAGRPALASIPEEEPACPDCNLVMVASSYLGTGPFVLRCVQCLALFARRPQLEALAAFNPPAPGPRPPQGWFARLVERLRGRRQNH